MGRGEGIPVWARGQILVRGFAAGLFASAGALQPAPPDLTKTAATLDDAELYWIMKNGIKMTGMPAFGPTHNQEELWAMVAFTRRLPEMSQSEYKKITEASEAVRASSRSR